MDTPLPPGPPATISARSAGPSDVPRVAQLHLLACELMAPQRGGARLVATRRRGATATEVAESLSAALSPTDRELVVGCIGSTVLGYGVVAVSGAGVGGTTAPHAELLELFVEAEARTVGIGAAIMASLVRYAREQGCSAIDTTVLPGDRATKNFFEDHSMAARAIVVTGDISS